MSYVRGTHEVTNYIGVGTLGGCPSFVPRELVAGLKKNKAAVEGFAGFCEAAGVSLTASVFLAPIGVPLAALGAVLMSLTNDCQNADTLRAQAKIALVGAQAAAVALPIASLAAAATIIGIPEAAVMGGLAAICQATVNVLKPIANGEVPSDAAVDSLINTVGGNKVSAADARKAANAFASHADDDAVKNDPKVQSVVKKEKSKPKPKEKPGPTLTTLTTPTFVTKAPTSPVLLAGVGALVAGAAFIWWKKLRG